MKKARVILLAVIATIVIVILFAAGESLAPLFLGSVFAYILTPAVTRLEKRGLKRKVALIFIYLTVIIIIFSVLWIGVPYLFSGVLSVQKAVSEYLASLSLELPQSIDSVVTKFGTQLFGYIGNVVSTFFSTIGVVVNIALGLVLSFYMILDREKIKTSLLELIPKSWHKFALNVSRSIDGVLRRFFTGQLTVAAITGTILFAGLLIIGVRQALFLALFAGISGIIPYFGSFLGSIPAVLAAAAQSPRKAVWTVVLFVAAQQIENIYVSPKILGGHVGLHPIVTIMAVIVGGHIFGFGGMLLAVPVCGMIRSVANEIIDTLGQKNNYPPA
ncbi:MAG: AI-2 transport protein TqsA [Firmicutes bacterium ADurb.Bin193]|nr:MAG: AI-2 transport protein TqsA [Firmicutes bacterium ADurb.Bin193]